MYVRTSHTPILPRAVARLVDAETGIITGIMNSSDTNYFRVELFQSVATVSNTRYLGPILADRIAAGTAFTKSSAFFASIGEAIERYCGNVTVRPMITGSYRDLVRDNLRALSPCMLPLYTDEQYKENDFPFVRFTDELTLRWVWGKSLVTEERILVPASIALLNLHPVAIQKEPRINFLNFSGIACGSTCDTAILAALLEVIERDATMLWWCSCDLPNAIDLSQWPNIEKYVGPAGETNGFSFKLFNIKNDTNVPTVAAVCFERSTSTITAGFAARLDPLEAALKSLSEAAQLHQLSRNLLNPESWIFKAQKTGILHHEALTPYRADRRYKESFRMDCKNMVDLFHNSQYYLDPRSVDEVDFLEKAPNVCSPPTEGILSLDELIGAVAMLGYDPIVVDLTTPDIADVGLTVMRAIIPGFVPNAPSAFPYMESTRLRLKRTGAHMSSLRQLPIPHS